MSQSRNVCSVIKVLKKEIQGGRIEWNRKICKNSQTGGWGLIGNKKAKTRKLPKLSKFEQIHFRDIVAFNCGCHFAF